MSMIGHAIEVKDVYNDICDMARYNDRTMHLQKYILSDVEWLIVEQLHPILNIFLHSTLKMEQESVPLIYQVIPDN